jgi:hypothetical protein
VLKTAKGAN